MNFRRLLPALSIAVTLSAAASAAWPASDTYEATIDSVLRSRDPVAESLFVAGNAARDAQQLAAASDLYSRVLQRVPDFAPAERRLAMVQLAAGNRAGAIQRLMPLAARDTSAYTLSAFAEVLMSSDAPLPGEVEAAHDYAVRAARQMPDDPSVLSTAFRVALAARDTALAGTAARGLVRAAPQEWVSWMALAIVSGAEQPGLAAGALTRARTLGMPAEAGTFAERVILHAREQRQHTLWLWAAVWTLAGWIALFVLLTAAGMVLSRMTLQAAGRSLAVPEGRPVGVDAWLRRTYSAVLWWCCGLWYVSLPIVTVLVVAIGGGLVYLSFRFGHVPIKLVLAVVLLTFFSVVSVIRSLFVRGRDEDPGTRLDPAEAPRLRAVLDKVAARVGTRPVDTVYLTPGTEIAVMERGGMRAQLRGRSERCLILGVGVLAGMTVGQLKSILAHEYGHFSNRDTAGGGLALSVRRSLFTMAAHLARSGVAGWYNPAWWFVNGFHAVFMRVSQGASRLQEVLADRWAASAYGSATFAQALTHVVEVSVRFDARATASLNEALKHQQPLPNLYRATPTVTAETQAEVDQEVKAAIEREPSDYDSHPAPRQRIAWLERFAARGEGSEPDDPDDAWSLLPDREALERRMTHEVLANVEQAHGVSFAREDPVPA